MGKSLVPDVSAREHEIADGRQPFEVRQPGIGHRLAVEVRLYEAEIAHRQCLGLRDSLNLITLANHDHAAEGEDPLSGLAIKEVWIDVDCTFRTGDGRHTTASKGVLAKQTQS